MIVVINYGMGNLRSVEKKVKRAGFDVVISSDLKIIGDASKLILPGVGHFAHGVYNLKESGIWELLQTKVMMERIPILGICLGMQLMATHSEEGNVGGLNWFDANVVKFSVKNWLKYKVPHMGWNSVKLKRKTILFQDISDDAVFYFDHAYHIVCNNDEDVLSSTEYEYGFISAIQKDNIFGTQFHPEKSHDWGEMIFQNFLRI